MVEKGGVVKIPDMDESWLNLLQGEFHKPYMVQLRQFLRTELQTHTLYPPMKEVFAAFKETSFPSVKVVILGQDPYHGKNQAHGLCFSVRSGVFPPPSLQNVFKEINSDLGLSLSALTGELTQWSHQGVFLLNTVLTVRANEAASHRGQGWEIFTDSVISLLNEHRTGLVFMLWGRFAQDKAKLLDPTKHKILKAAHPSPFSAHQGFLGCRHFSTANAYLKANGEPEIDWQL